MDSMEPACSLYLITTLDFVGFKYSWMYGRYGRYLQKPKVAPLLHKLSYHPQTGFGQELQASALKIERPSISRFLKYERERRYPLRSQIFVQTRPSNDAECCDRDRNANCIGTSLDVGIHWRRRRGACHGQSNLCFVPRVSRNG